MLKLRGALPINGDSRPVVGPRFVLPVSTNVYHGLHSEGVPGAHNAHSLVLRVVRNVWGGVEEVGDAMA